MAKEEEIVSQEDLDLGVSEDAEDEVKDTTGEEPSVNVSIPKEDILNIRLEMRQKLLMQFHYLKESAELCQASGMHSDADSNFQESSKILRMLFELDKRLTSNE